MSEDKTYGIDREAHIDELRQTLEVVRIVAGHWFAGTVDARKARESWAAAVGHLAGIVLAACDGEVNPVALGITEGTPDYERLARIAAERSS